MRTSYTRPALGLVAALSLLLAGCDGGEDVTSRNLRSARQRWDDARIRDYDLEWTATGPRNGHYLVFVRGGKVQAVRSVLGDGREVDQHPADPSFYGVDGLFTVIEDELAQAVSDAPFGQPKNTRLLLRFTPDPKLGYPRSYRRDVVGTRLGLAIDVIRLAPNPPSPIPPAKGT